MIITFIGHSKLNDSNLLREQLYTTIMKNIKPKENNTFYCGGYGDFDILCAVVCKSIKDSVPNCESVYISPYFTPSAQKKMRYLIESNLYDSTIYPPIEEVPPKFALIKRNEWMITEADLVISYVKHTYGGAYKSLEYARRNKKRIINITE